MNKNINRTGSLILLSIIVASLAATLVACDKTPTQKDAAEKEHFLTEKMETIKKAEAVEQMVHDAAALQRQRIDEESQ